MTIYPRPGSGIDIVVAMDYDTEVVDVRRALVYDILDHDIVVSQPNPPVTHRYLGNQVAMTYLVSENETRIRYGFHGIISDLIDDYTLSSAEKVRAVLLKRVSEPSRFNVRMHFRVKPGIDSDLGVTLNGEQVNVIDISIGGAKIIHHKDHGFKSQSKVKVVVNIDGEQYGLDAQILRVWIPSGSKKVENVSFLAMKFLNLERKAEDHLARKVREIERESRSKEPLF